MISAFLLSFTLKAVNLGFVQRVSDVDLVVYPIEVVGHWDGSPKTSYQGNDLNDFGSKANISVTTVVRGKLNKGQYTVRFRGFDWNEKGERVCSTGSVLSDAEVRSVRRDTIWFLKPVPGSTEFLADSIDCVKEAFLLPYYDSLRSSDPGAGLALCLSSSNEDLVQRTLYFAAGEDKPWPFDYRFCCGNANPVPTLAGPVHDFILNGAHPSLRPIAVAVYAKIEGKAALSFLRQLLEDPENKVKLVSACWLAKYNDTPSEHKIFSICNSSVLKGSPGILGSMIKAISETENLAFVPVLTRCLDDAEPYEFGIDGTGLNVPLPEVDAVKALKKFTGAVFPENPPEALSAWIQTAALEPAQRNHKLIQRFGTLEVPIAITAQQLPPTREGDHLVKLQVRNIGKRTVTVSDPPPYRGAVVSGGVSEAPLDVLPGSPRERFVQLAPGQFYICKALLPEDLKDIKKLDFVFFQADKPAPDHWEGTVRATWLSHKSGK